MSIWAVIVVYGVVPLVWVMICAISLKFVIWLFNTFIIAESKQVPAPGMVRSIGINFFYAVLCVAGFYASFAIYGLFSPKMSNAQFVTFEWMQVSAAFAAMVVLLWRMLPTTFGRAFFIAAVNSFILFWIAAGILLLVLMYAFSSQPKERSSLILFALRN